MSTWMRKAQLLLVVIHAAIAAAQQCSRYSSTSGICCANSAYTVPSGANPQAFCRITGVQSSNQCPPGYLYQSQWSQCVRALSTAAGAGTGATPQSHSTGFGSFSTCSSSNDCSAVSATTSICCTGSAFTLAPGTRLDVMCVVHGVTPSTPCPAGYAHQGHQCYLFLYPG